MLLSWSDQTGIARALHKAYPETDRLSLGMGDIANLIAALPQAPKGAPPSEKFLLSILWTWMRLSGEEGAAA